MRTTQQQLAMVLLPALILSSITSVMLGFVLTQIIVQHKIVANHRNSWLILHNLEDDVARFKTNQPLLTSTLTKMSDTYIIADKERPSYKIYLSIDTKNWWFDNS